MTELIKVKAVVGGQPIVFQGAKWFYGDADIRSKCGLENFDDAALNDGQLSPRIGANKEYLVRLVATLKRDTVLTNSAQGDRGRSYSFYCDPEKAESAMLGLPGKSVDASLLPGNFKIQRVYRKPETSRR